MIVDKQMLLRIGAPIDVSDESIWIAIDANNTGVLILANRTIEYLRIVLHSSNPMFQQYWRQNKVVNFRLSWSNSFEGLTNMILVYLFTLLIQRKENNADSGTIAFNGVI
jgi:hypothetical protein